MLDKLEAIYSRYQEIEQQMNDPQVTADMKRYVKLSKDYKDLQPVVKAYHEYKSLLDTIAECKELLESEKDPELREMAKEELTAAQERREPMEENIRRSRELTAPLTEEYINNVYKNIWIVAR